MPASADNVHCMDGGAEEEWFDIPGQAVSRKPMADGGWRMRRTVDIKIDNMFYGTESIDDSTCMHIPSRR